MIREIGHRLPSHIRCGFTSSPDYSVRCEIHLLAHARCPSRRTTRPSPPFQRARPSAGTERESTRPARLPGVQRKDGPEDEKEAILSDMVGMAAQLKTEALGINKLLEQDNDNLGQIQDAAGTNIDRVAKARENIGRQHRKKFAMACGSMFAFAAVALAFFMTVMFMRVFPKW